MTDFCCTIFLTYNLSSKIVRQLDVFESVLNHSGIVALMPLNVSSCCNRGAQWGPVHFHLQAHRHHKFTDWLSLFLMHCILPEPLRNTPTNWTCSYFERFVFDLYATQLAFLLLLCMFHVSICDQIKNVTFQTNKIKYEYEDLWKCQVRCSVKYYNEISTLRKCKLINVWMAGLTPNNSNFIFAEILTCFVSFSFFLYNKFIFCISSTCTVFVLVGYNVYSCDATIWWS